MPTVFSPSGSEQIKPRSISRVVGFAQVKEEAEGRGTRSKTRYPIDTQPTLALAPTLLLDTFA